MQSLSLLDRAMGILEICSQSGNESERCDAIGYQYLNGLVLTDLSAEIRQAIDHYGLVYNDIMQKYEVDSPDQPIIRDPEDAVEILGILNSLGELIRNSESDRILHKLGDHGDSLPVAEITEASRYREWFAPLLLHKFQSIVESHFPQHANGGAESNDDLDSDSSIPFLAIFLFAEWNFADSVPAVLRALELPEATLEALWGDALFDVLPRYLAQFFASELDRLDELIRNQQTDHLLRWTIAGTYEYLVRDGVISVEDAVGRLDRLFEDIKVIDQECYPTSEHPFLLSAGIAMTLWNIGGTSLSKLATSQQDWEFVDKNMIDRQSFVDTKDESYVKNLRPTKPNTIDELSRWASYAPKAETPPKPSTTSKIESRVDKETPKPLPPNFQTGTVRSGEKTSRNSPCPCGSGKKFKHCCLNASKTSFR